MSLKKIKRFSDYMKTQSLWPLKKRFARERESNIQGRISIIDPKKTSNDIKREIASNGMGVYASTMNFCFFECDHHASRLAKKLLTTSTMQKKNCAEQRNIETGRKWFFLTKLILSSRMQVQFWSLLAWEPLEPATSSRHPNNLKDWCFGNVSSLPN